MLKEKFLVFLDVKIFLFFHPLVFDKRFAINEEFNQLELVKLLYMCVNENFNFYVFYVYVKDTRLY